MTTHNMTVDYRVRCVIRPGSDPPYEILRYGMTSREYVHQTNVWMYSKTTVQDVHDTFDYGEGRYPIRRRHDR
jgi:hypothetical protein